MKQKFEIIIENDAPKYDGIMDKIYAKSFGPGRFAKAAHLLRENNICKYDISKIARNSQNDEIIGGCRMWPIAFAKGGKALFLGPIAIDENYRNFGLGAKLVEAVLLANKNNENLPVFLVGDYDFFAKFGFEKISNDIVKLPSPALFGRILYFNDGKKLNDNFSGEIFAPSPKP